MASTLYILLPSRAVARELPQWSERAHPFALVSDSGALQQQGHQTFVQLRAVATAAKQVTLLLAASDVSLMSVKIPPMSAAKLKAALPNLLEDQLLADPAELILLSAPPVAGMCTIAAVERSWMESLHAEMQAFGPKKLTAHALSMTMQADPGTMSAIVDPEEQVTELAFQLAGQLGGGLTLDRLGDAESSESPEQTARQVLQTLRLFSGEVALKVWLPADQLSLYQHVYDVDNAGALSPDMYGGGMGLDPQAGTGPEARHEPELEPGQTLQFNVVDWHCRIAGISSSTINLMSPVSQNNLSSFDWNRWRWPLTLAAAALLVNLVGLNLQWLVLKREAQGLTDSLTQAYRTSFPRESVIRDPLAQMQQKINLSKKIAGESVPDDFLVLASQFGLVWDSAMAGKTQLPSITSIEYRDRSLFIKIKSTGLLPLEQIRTGLQRYALLLVSSTDGVLQVRPARGDEK
jgi:general secretion pathway protein L